MFFYISKIEQVDEILLLDAESIRAWLKLLKHGKPVTVRGFQRLMGYNSPGKAQRILRRLERYGLIRKAESGEYIVVRKLPDYLSSYVILKGYVIPRSLAIAVFISGTSVTYVILARPPLHIDLLLLFLSIPNWIDTFYYLRILRRILGEA